MTANRLLKNTGAWGMDSLNVYFKTDSQEEVEQESQQYPGRIIFCDQSTIEDTKNQQSLGGIYERNKLRSLATMAQTTDPKVLPAQQADLPCVLCPACHKDPVNTICRYAIWRKPRKIEIIEQGEPT